MTEKNIWQDILGSPTLIVAPMVDASELAWRLLSRRHGAQLCYTPMLHSSVFCKDLKYRTDALTSIPEDRPLIVQFCGNDPETLLKASLLAEPFCDAIDINIGCPQAIAKRGHYGAYLQDDWPLLEKIVSNLKQNLRIPVTCKLRVFTDINKTIEYAKMLEAAGADLLTVHGRTREQRGPLTGLASWQHIKAVKESVKVPVFANGNIQCIQDVEKCLKETGVEGVMTAEGNLYNPYLFEGCYPPCWEPALEYLNIVEQYPAPYSFVRGHLFKLFQHIFCLPENADERSTLARNSSLEAFRNVSNAIKNRYLPYHEGKIVWKSDQDNLDYNLELPPWLCQSYVRDTPEEHFNKVEAKRIQSEAKCKRFLDDEGNEISRKKMKKLRRINKRPNRVNSTVKRKTELCQKCPNPLASKCQFKLCRQCCRSYCFIDNLDCVGHRNLAKTRRQIAINFANERNEGKSLM